MKKNTLQATLRKMGKECAKETRLILTEEKRARMYQKLITKSKHTPKRGL